MQVLADFPWENGQEWIDELRRQAAGHQILAELDNIDPAGIEAAIVWRPSVDFFKPLANLRAPIVPAPVSIN